MAGLSFVSMYALMYSMVNSLDNVLPSVNQLYMAALMTSPMVIIELLLMRMMSKNLRVNAVILSLSVLALIGFFILIRQQTAVSDRQFLKSMIPHHAGAILMCEQAGITDPEIKKLCEEIVASQRREIEQMKTMLRQLETGDKQVSKTNERR